MGKNGMFEVKHGSRALDKILRANLLDKRTRTGRLLKRITEDLMEDAGGPTHVTHREKYLIQHTASLLLLIGTIEGWAFSQASVIDEHGKMPAALGQHYIAYVNSLRLNLVALGLKPERPAHDVTLPEYIAQKQQPSQGPTE